MESTGGKAMRPRVILADCILKIGSLIQSLAPMVMRPDDLIEFSRRTYAKTGNVKSWAEPGVVNIGLSPEESKLLEQIPLKEGNALLLGVGGGRDAIPLGKSGFQVTGVDFIPEMVEMAIQNAAKQGIHLDGIVQEISRIEMPASSYDVVWLSAAMYSCIPTRKRRLEMLRRIRNVLKPAGYFICQFHCDTRKGNRLSVHLLKRFTAFITLGNLWYENGDQLLYNIEFVHGFSSEEQLKREFQEGGFEVLYSYFPDRLSRGGAVLKAV